jgi:hypothetical protein
MFANNSNLIPAGVVDAFWPVVVATIDNAISQDKLDTTIATAAPLVLAFFEQRPDAEAKMKFKKEVLLPLMMVPALARIKKIAAESPDIHAGGAAPKKPNVTVFQYALDVVQGAKPTAEKVKKGQHKRTFIEHELVNHCARRLSDLLIKMDVPALDNRGAKRGVAKPRKEATPEQRSKLAEMRATKVKVSDKPSLRRWFVQEGAVMQFVIGKHADLVDAELRAIVDTFWAKVNTLPTDK